MADSPITEVSGKLTTELGHWCYAHPQEAADRIDQLTNFIRENLPEKIDQLFKEIA